MKNTIISTGDKDLQDEVGLCEWDENTYDCVMDVVNKMLKLKGYDFNELDDTCVTIQVSFSEVK